MLTFVLAPMQSQAHPSEIMVEVLKSLQDLDINWKIIEPYCIRYDFLSNDDEDFVTDCGFGHPVVLWKKLRCCH